MKKSKIVIIIIVCLLLGLGIYFLFKGNNKQETKNSNEYNKALVNTNLAENLKSKNIGYKKLDELKELFSLGENERKIYQWNDTIFKYGEFKANGKTIYVDYNKIILSANKPTGTSEDEYDEDIVNIVKVYLLDDYYLLISYDGAGDGGLFKIFNKKLNEEFSDFLESEMLIADKFVYYTTYECKKGKRPDGSTGPQKEVHKLNLETMHSSFDFYLNHDAGWKC